MTQPKPIGFFRKIFASSPSGEQPTAISIGDRFSRIDDEQMVWIVDKVQKETSLITMHREGHPDLLKVLSEAAFDGAGEYHRCPQ